MLPTAPELAAELPRAEMTPQSVDELLPGHEGLVQVGGNRLVLFDTSMPLIAAMERDIRAARERVWLESYIIADDEAGRRIAEALKERARAGLDVRVMYDAIGSFSTPARYFEDLRAAGVKVHAYMTLREAWRRAPLREFWSVLRLMNRRNHRKLAIIDDRLAYFGGMNIVDQRPLKTVEDTRRRGLPSSAGCRDVHVRADGPVQAEAAAAFDRLWRRVHGERVRRWPRVSIRPQLANPDESIVCYDLRPAIRDSRAARVFIPLIRQARRQITISMAYFVPMRGLVHELRRAHRRGVTVRIIVPGNSDVWAVQCASRHFYHHLLDHGIRIFERKDLMLHSKVMVVDDQWTVVGSCNLDPRSFRLNLEFLAVVRSRAMAAAVGRIIRYDLRHSRKVRLAGCRRRRWWQRLIDRLAWACRSLL